MLARSLERWVGTMADAMTTPSLAPHDREDVVRGCVGGLAEYAIRRTQAESEDVLDRVRAEMAGALARRGIGDRTAASIADEIRATVRKGREFLAAQAGRVGNA